MNSKSSTKRQNISRNVNGSIILCCFVKFFRKLKYAEDLLGGLFYFNSPAYYRECGLEGVGDACESLCYHGPFDPNLQMRFTTLGEMVKSSNFPVEQVDGNMTIAIDRPDLKPGWLHCWFAVDKAMSPQETGPFLTDLQRVRQEFGGNFVSFEASKLDDIVTRLKRAGADPLRISRVGYSNSRLHQNVACKNKEYSYQREFRFIVSECDHTDTSPKAFEVGDMTDILKLNEPFSASFENTGEVFRLTPKDLIIDEKYITVSVR